MNQTKETYKNQCNLCVLSVYCNDADCNLCELISMKGKYFKRITKSQARKTNTNVFVALVTQNDLTSYSKLIEVNKEYDFDLQIELIEYYNKCYEIGNYLEYFIEYNCLEALKNGRSKIETPQEAIK